MLKINIGDGGRTDGLRKFKEEQQNPGGALHHALKADKINRSLCHRLQIRGEEILLEVTFGTVFMVSAVQM